MHTGKNHYNRNCYCIVAPLVSQRSAYLGRTKRFTEKGKSKAKTAVPKEIKHSPKMTSLQIGDYSPMKRNHIYGPYARLTMRIAKMLIQPYRWEGTLCAGPAVYVCRHADMLGPIHSILCVPEQLHPMVLHVFTTLQTCRRQYSEYTFTARCGKSGLFRRSLGWLASILVVPLMKSLQAIPVYRGGYNSIKTLRIAMKHLLNGESIIVWPDINYTQKTGIVEKIYPGFLLLGEMYLKQTGRPLPIVPLTLREDLHVITSSASLFVNSYHSDAEATASKLALVISGGSKTA